MPNGTTLNADMYVKEDLEISKYNFQKIKLHVIDMKSGIILGCDFFNRWKAKIDFEKHHVRLLHGKSNVIVSG